jgi:colanic acid biosynthesis glycosyl transferase WcaI
LITLGTVKGRKIELEDLEENSIWGRYSMRFLVLTQYFRPEIGAPQVRLAAMIREMVRTGYEVEVVTALPNYPMGEISSAYRGKFYDFEEWDGVPIHRVWLYPSTGAGLKRILNYVSFALSSLVGLARAQRPDYIFVESPPLFLSPIAYLASLWWHVPFIFNVADLWPDSVRELGLMRDGVFLRLAESMERWTYRKAAYINAVTEGIKTTLIGKKNVPPHQVLFLPNGVDTELFNPQVPDIELAKRLGLQDKKVVLYAGTIGFAQGLEVALEAMELLRSDLPQAILIFIGGGSRKESLMHLAQSKQLSNVRFMDPEPPEFVAQLYSIACAGLVSLKNLALFEGARPSKILPIMASGKPVLYSGAGEGARLIEKANAGIVVRPEDPHTLSGAIRTIVTNPKLASELGKNGRRYVEEHLNWPAVIKDWIEQLVEREGMHG